MKKKENQLALFEMLSYRSYKFTLFIGVQYDGNNEIEIANHLGYRQSIF